MIKLKTGKYGIALGAITALFLTLPAIAQTQTAAPAAATPASQASSSSASSSSSDDVTTVTIFGRKRTPGDVTQTQIETNTAASCGFMSDYSPLNQDIVQDYLRDFGSTDNGTGQANTIDSNGNAVNVDQTDPNVAGNHFKDNSPYGNASVENSANSNTILPVDSNGNPTTISGPCDPSDKAFAAGRNYIARNDHTLTDAFASFDAKNYSKALEQFKGSFNKMGYDQAALMIAKMYLSGMGTPRDSTQGIFWLKKVAEAKFDPGKDVQAFNAEDPEYANTRSDAATMLAKIYLTGWGGVPKDSKQAKYWYTKADEFGYIPATHVLGEMYEFGYGDTKDVSKAASFFKKAATVGYTPSQYELGVLYYGGDAGLAQDKATAAQWLLQAAKGGHVGALLAVARMYDFGDTLPMDQQKAIVYYKEAALKGNSEAEDALGLDFYTGNIVPKDPTTARKWFQLAARQGDPDAMFNLAVMLVNGEGGAKDMAVGYVWFSLADQSGSDKAAAAMHEIEPKLTADERAKADSVLHPKAK